MVNNRYARICANTQFLLIKKVCRLEGLKQLLASLVLLPCLGTALLQADDTFDRYVGAKELSVKPWEPTSVELQKKMNDEWQEYMKPMMPMGGRLAKLMADPDDPLLRQELYAKIFRGMHAAYFSLFIGDPEYPDFYPQWTEASDFIAANPDNVYLMSPLHGDGIYKITGFRGTVHMIDVAIGNNPFITYGEVTWGPTLADYDVDNLNINKKTGWFEVILSPERPKGYKGDWWELAPEANYILIRQTAYDWVNERDGRFSIERLDRPASKPRLTEEQIEKKLKQLPMLAKNWLDFAIDYFQKLHALGYVNKLWVHDMAAIGGLSTGVYIEGLFDIEPDEALIYESEIPECKFWNITLTDMLESRIDIVSRQSSISGFTAKLDSDGKFRAVVAGTDPGVPNWLDTAGYTKGELFGRWTMCDETPTPSLTKVKLADVRNHLPDDTPVITADEREAALRLRKRGRQMRRRW